MPTYIKFTEHNKSEKETWNFYIRVEGNELALEGLKKIIDELPEYSLTAVFSEKKVNSLVEKSKIGYFRFENLLNAALDIEMLQSNLGELVHPLYKGGIMNFVTKPIGRWEN